MNELEKTEMEIDKKWKYTEVPGGLVLKDSELSLLWLKFPGLQPQKKKNLEKINYIWVKLLAAS